MKKIAIVGTTISLSENEERDMIQSIATFLNQSFTSNDTIISGGARGVDTIAIEVAHGLGFKTKTFPPQTQHWEDVDGKIGFKSRNLEIASQCDELYCFSVPVHKTTCYHHHHDDISQKHEKTAGCWTLIQVKDMGKPCQLFVIPSR